MFIVIDGPDGSGKTALCRALNDGLLALGHPVCLTAEPHLPTTRAWLSNPAVTPRELAVAFAHDRHRHMHEVVLPALAAGQVVVCDRYVLSTIVYQSLHNDPAFVASLVSDAREPDLTLVLDAPTWLCMQRLARTGKTPDRYEAGAELQAAVRRHYLDLAIQRGYTILNGAHPPGDVAAAALDLVLQTIFTFGLPGGTR
jgi:dTMP kinase